MPREERLTIAARRSHERVAREAPPAARPLRAPDARRVLRLRVTLADGRQPLVWPRFASYRRALASLPGAIRRAARLGAVVGAALERELQTLRPGDADGGAWHVIEQWGPEVVCRILAQRRPGPAAALPVVHEPGTAAPSDSGARAPSVAPRQTHVDARRPGAATPRLPARSRPATEGLGRSSTSVAPAAAPAERAGRRPRSATHRWQLFATIAGMVVLWLALTAWFLGGELDRLWSSPAQAAAVGSVDWPREAPSGFRPAVELQANTGQ